MSGYEIYAVRYAALRTRRSELFYRHSSYGEPDAEIEMAYYFWVLRGSGETIVVDTGFGPAGRSAPGPNVPRAADRCGARAGDRPGVGLDRRRHAFPLRPRREPRRLPEGAADRAGDRARILGGADGRAIPVRLARRAGGGRVHREGPPRKVVSERPRERRRSWTESPRSRSADIRPDSSSRWSRGTTGPVVLASDAVHFYEELELERPFAVMHDLERMYAAYGVLEEFARSGAIVVPGHDPDVARRHASAGDSDPTVVPHRLKHTYHDRLQRSKRR